MDKKRRLLDALAPLEMPFEKKQDFVNLLIENNNGNNGNTSASGITYFDISSIKNSDDIETLCWHATVVKKVTNTNNIVFSPKDDIEGRGVLAISCDLSATFSTFDESGYPNGRMTVEETILDEAPWILDLPRITEKEFYDNYETFFVLDGPGNFYAVKFDEGMTWKEWVASSYNPGVFFIDITQWTNEEAIFFVDSYNNRLPLYVSSTSQITKPDDVLVSGELYFIWVA